VNSYFQHNHGKNYVHRNMKENQDYGVRNITTPSVVAKSLGFGDHLYLTGSKHQ